jgi:TRAP-type transport system periplasmic protein
MTSTIAYQRKLAAEQESQKFAELKAKMVYTEIAPEARDEMRKAALAVIKDVKTRAGNDLVNQVMSDVVNR